MAERPPCTVSKCERPQYGREVCNMHYQRLRKHGDTEHERAPRRVGVAQCTVDGCESFMRARGWCTAHWTRWKRHGSPTARMRGEVVGGRRVCPSCDVDKPTAEWGAGQGECKACACARASAYRARHPYVPKAYLACTCDCCGNAFMGNAKQSRYCSPGCAAANKNRANWKHLARRRARLRGALVESFDRVEIFERDAWMCGLCDESVDRALAWPNPLSASLDHVVPIALGGKHSRENARCSHLTCNVRKGARLDEAVN